MTPARSEEAARAFFGRVLEEIDSGGVAVERVRHSDRCFDYNLCVLLAALLQRREAEVREECARIVREWDPHPHRANAEKTRLLFDLEVAIRASAGEGDK